MEAKPFQMRLSKTVGGGRGALVVVEGFLDAHTVVDFDERISEILHGGAVRIALCMENLNYISSAGIGAIMGLVQRLRRESGELVLVRPSKNARRILQTLGFLEMLPVAESERAALKKLRGAAPAKRP